MAVSVPETFLKTLDEFFAKKTCQDVDRSTFLHISLEDKTNKITLTFIFMRDWDATEYDDFSRVIIERKGAVFTFPPYWICVPKELAIPYFEYIITDFYNEYVSKWVSEGNTSNNQDGCCNIPNHCNINNYGTGNPPQTMPGYNYI